ncbi:MAG: hypothetical protein ACI4E5_12125 [Suilimivivens sp.]
MNRKFYDEKGNLDIMFFGPSSTLHAISTPVLWKEYGIAAWNWGMPNQFTFMSYYYIKEAIRYKKPKIIAYDAYGLLGEAESMLGNYTNQYSLYPMKLGRTKLEAVADLEKMRKVYADEMNAANSGTVLQYIVPLYQFHERWKELEEKDFLGTNYSYIADYDGTRIAAFSKGGGISRLYSIPQDVTLRNEQFHFELGSLGVEYFNKIYQLCEEEGIQLILYNVPMIDFNTNLHNQIQELANEYGLEYLDLCMLENEVGIDYDTDAVDTHHLNLWGSYKTSVYFGQYLQEKYAFEDKRGNTEYADWDAVAQICYQKIADGPIEEKVDGTE